MQSKKLSVSVPCPVCEGQMNVRELECPACNITLRGDFGSVTASKAVSNRFDPLTAEQMTFLETFLRCRGIIRDVEAALGISYPTVRARLDSLLAALGLVGAENTAGDRSNAAPDPAPADKQSLKDILSRLDSGAIDAQSALDAIRGGSPGETK
jgi:hypothetical protein